MIPIPVPFSKRESIMDDLEFLAEMKSEDLDILVSTLTHDKDGEKRWTESLTSNRAYKQYYPDHQKYLWVIVDELQCFGGNTIINKFRSVKNKLFWINPFVFSSGRNGVPYREILCDVCDKCKVNYNENSEVERIEELLLQKILEDSLEKMPKEKLEEISRELGINKTRNIGNLAKGNLATMIMQSAIQAGGFASYKIALIVANAVAKQMLGRGLTLAANATLTRTIGVFAGPLGWAFTALWMAWDFAGPAYRVTIPAVIQVAYLRQKNDMDKKNAWKDLEEASKNNQ